MSYILQSDQVIFIISGPTACGKSRLGQKLGEVYGSQAAVYDADDLHVDEQYKPDSVDEFGDSAEYGKIRRETARDELAQFVFNNQDKRALFIVGFFEKDDISDVRYAEYVSSFTTERYYLAIPMHELFDNFFKRFESLTEQHDCVRLALESGKLVRPTKTDYATYEAELWGMHSAYGFLRMSESSILDRIQGLVYKLDPRQRIVYTPKERRKDRIVSVSMLFDGKKKVDVEVETADGKRKIFMPIAQARKIWSMAYRLNSDGRFYLKYQPRYTDSVLYDGYYGCGTNISDLISSIAVFIK